MKTKNFLKSIFTMTIFLLLFLGFACLSDVNATTYYVSPTGNDSNSGSVSSPFRTIQKAAIIVNPGDTVIVKDGTYTDTNSDGFIVNLTVSGTSSAWITFKAENKWGAKLDGQDNTTNYGWNFGSISYVRVEDFDIYGCKWSGFWSNLNASHIYIYRNKIHDIGRWDGCPHCDYGRPGVYIGHGASYHTFDSNIFYTIGRFPQMEGGTCIGEDHSPSCVCGDTMVAGDPCYWHYWNHDHGIYTFGTYNLIINNVFYDLTAGWAVMLAGNEAVNSKVINNTFDVRNPGRSGAIAVQQNTNLEIDNNIFYNPKDVAIYGTTTDPSGNIKNNLVYGASLASAGLCGDTFTCVNNIEGQDPKFVDKSKNNYRLNGNSPAINAAYSAGAPALDFDGNMRPSGGSYDIGAYEYTTPDATPPAPPAIIGIQ